MPGKRKKINCPAGVCAVIVAAGSSQRMGGDNKLLLELAGTPLLVHTLGAFERCDVVRDIVLVCGEQDILPYTTLARSAGISKLYAVVRGGDSRTTSARAWLGAAPADTVMVAVHDGARPLVSEALIAEAVYAAAEHGAAAPVVPVKDSIKRIENGRITADVARDTLAAVQTPQVFRRALLERALSGAARAGRTYTDDCAAVEAYGQPVFVTHGSYQNIKITTPEDLLIAQAFLQGEAD